MTDSVFSPADAAAAAGTIPAIGDAPGGTGLALAGAGPVSAEALAALAAAIDFAGQALAPATLRAYRADWQHFCAWCRTAGWAALPAAPATVAAYLASLAKTHTGSALVRRLAALSRAHRLARQPWPAADPANLVVLHGGMTAAARSAAKALLHVPDDQERLILATGRYLGEGFDDSRLDTLFLTMPISWKGTLAQYVGRLHREHQGKNEVLVYDYTDSAVPVLARMAARRGAGYRALGYVVT